MSVSVADRVAQNPFWFRDCFIMTMPIGQRAINLRELLHALHEVSDAVLFYHLFQYRLAITTPAVEYPNDFAVWAANSLRDPKLAEKLSSFDPFDYDNLEQLRRAMTDLLEEYLWDLPYIPWARPGMEFYFCEGATVVFRSRISARTLREFYETLKKVGYDSIYYHLFEGRWRLGMREKDDFSYWIETNFGLPELVTAIRNIDVYLYSLPEIQTILLKLLERHLGVPE
ncbi:MAG: hypothetical protein JRI59_04075 [Deltaproteobacteria bacterium]|nr:hypothetical protein [Deltaproteobacteria bacterium]